MSPSLAETDAASKDVAAYIADMLAELAEMAARQRDPALEVVIRIAAIQAERSRRERR